MPAAGLEVIGERIDFDSEKLKFSVSDIGFDQSVKFGGGHFVRFDKCVYTVAAAFEKLEVLAHFLRVVGHGLKVVYKSPRFGIEHAGRLTLVFDNSDNRFPVTFAKTAQATWWKTAHFENIVVEPGRSKVFGKPF